MYQFFCSQVPSSVVERLFNLQELPLLHQKEHNLLLLLDAFFKGWDAQLWHQTASGLLYHEGSRLHINRATTFRIIWRSDSDSESVDFPRYFFSGFLSEQVGRYPLSGMCFLIWRIILWTNAMGSDSGISLPRVYNIPTNSLFMRVKMIQIECVFGWLLNLLFWFRCSIKSVFDYNHQWWICFATSLNHKLVFFNFSWDGLDSLFGPVTLILQVMQVNHLAFKAPLIFNL